MAPKRSYSHVEIAEVADGLRRLLDQVEAGRLTADSGMVTRLEGALAALEALVGVEEAKEQLEPKSRSHRPP